MEPTFEKKDNELVETKLVSYDKDTLLAEKEGHLATIAWHQGQIDTAQALLAEVEGKLAKAEEFGLKTKEELEAEQVVEVPEEEVM